MTPRVNEFHEKAIERESCKVTRVPESMYILLCFSMERIFVFFKVLRLVSLQLTSRKKRK